MNTVDLHSLYATRSLGRARAFVNRSGGGNNGNGGGNKGGPGGSSPSAGSGFGLATGVGVVNAEVNRRDQLGRTVLHLAASEVADWALEWVELLLGVAGVQVNLVDTESGWSALHRALYAGNIAAARHLLAHRDIDSRLKDHEQLSPFDVYNSTVEGTNPSDTLSSVNPGRLELFTWGSNRNYVLGVESDGDRAFPERVQLKREEGGTGLKRYEPLRVKDISMARLHTGIITDERSNNIRLCGYGTGGRLGPTSQTQFTFIPLPSFPHQVSSVTLSPDHTVVVTTSGDVFTFGLNRFSQLGYLLDSPSIPRDEPIQSTPRRVVGALKKEVVLGAAASRTHTAVFTADSLYTWGTNKGQLGYPAAGSLVQIMPRKVTAIPGPIMMLSATENATCVLLASKDVLVLQGEAYVRIAFPLARFPTKMQAYRPPQVSSKPNIDKIASCGNTFAALSSLGDVFTFSLDPSSSEGASTRNPPKPQRVWSLRRNFTAVTDFGVGLDGSIILCTLSGHVFVRTKKFEASSVGKASGSATPPSASASTSTSTSSRNNANSTNGWKFSRVPYLQRVIKVAANSTGAFAAIRSDVPLRFIDIEGPSLSDNLLGILPHWRRIGPVSSKVGSRTRRESEDEEEEDGDAGVERDVEVALKLLSVLEKWDESWETPLAGTDVHLVATGGLAVPAHRLVLASRSPVLAARLATHDSIELPDCSPFTLLLLLHYLYSDDTPAIWDSRVGSALRDRLSSSNPTLDISSTKSQLRTLSTTLDLPYLAQSLLFHVKTLPSPSLSSTLSTIQSNGETADVVLELEDREVRCHSIVLRARCAFFETFFEDEEWSRERREENVVRIDLRHVRADVMDVVLKHVYLDAGVELFNHINRATGDEYIDFVSQVLAAANELLLDKLKLVCSAVLRSFVTLHNVCAILVDAAFYEAHDLVRACLYFLASSMETVLESRLLDDLPPDLVAAVSTFCRERQGARMPISRSGLLTQELMVKHASYLADLDVAKPTGGARKFRPLATPRSPLLSPGPSPQLRPRGRQQSLSPNASPSLPPMREDGDEPFTMDDDFSLDAPAPASGAMSPIARRRPSMQGSASPSSSFTPIGSPPPPRLQPWGTKVSSVAPSSSPRDLRSIMATEALAEQQRRPRVSLDRGTTDPARSSPSTPRITTPTSSGGSWKPTPSPSWRSSDAPRPSLADIMATESARPSPPLQPQPQSRPSGSRTPTSAPLSPSPSHNPASAVGAPVITPSRFLSSSTSSNPSSSRPKSSFGAADVPWTNFNVAPPSPTPDPFLMFAGASITPPSASFADIQRGQKAEVDAIKEVKAPRSFQEVMKAEVEEERSRNEALEFERWWAAETARVQREEIALAVGVGGSGSNAGRGGAKRGGGRGRGNRGGGRGAKKGAGAPKEARTASA